MRKTIADLTGEFVRSILDYDHVIGVMKWKNCNNNPYAGKNAAKELCGQFARAA